AHQVGGFLLDRRGLGLGRRDVPAGAQDREAQRAQQREHLRVAAPHLLVDLEGGGVDLEVRVVLAEVGEPALEVQRAAGAEHLGELLPLGRRPRLRIRVGDQVADPEGRQHALEAAPHSTPPKRRWRSIGRGLNQPSPALPELPAAIAAISLAVTTPLPTIAECSAIVCCGRSLACQASAIALARSAWPLSVRLASYRMPPPSVTIRLTALRSALRSRSSGISMRRSSNSRLTPSIRWLLMSAVYSTGSHFDGYSRCSSSAFCMPRPLASIACRRTSGRNSLARAFCAAKVALRWQSIARTT